MPPFPGQSIVGEGSDLRTVHIEVEPAAAKFAGFGKAILKVLRKVSHWFSHKGSFGFVSHLVGTPLVARNKSGWPPRRHRSMDRNPWAWARPSVRSALGVLGHNQRRLRSASNGSPCSYSSSAWGNESFWLVLFFLREGVCERNRSSQPLKNRKYPGRTTRGRYYGDNSHKLPLLLSIWRQIQVKDSEVSA